MQHAFMLVRQQGDDFVALLHVFYARIFLSDSAVGLVECAN
jgi:hypothetical protein